MNAASPIPNLVSCFNYLSPDFRCGGVGAASQPGNLAAAAKRSVAAVNGAALASPAKRDYGKPMQFLKTLFWMVVAVSIAIFATRNWRDVTIDLWGPLAADIKLPLLMGLMLLLGWLPTWLILRSRLWQVRRKLALLERPPVPAPVTPPLADPVTADAPVLP
jgi:uncharacterized integral membrane protein